MRVHIQLVYKNEQNRFSNHSVKFLYVIRKPNQLQCNWPTKKTCLGIRYVFKVHKMVTYPLTYTNKIVSHIQVEVYVFMK